MAFIDAAKIPATGHPRIDTSHRALAEQVNALYEMWQAGAPQADVLRALDLLVRAVGRHFAEEEEIGAAAGYDGLERHAARHRDLLGRLTELVESLRGAEGYRDLTIDVFALIDTLLYEHEIIDDQDYWLLFRDGVPDPRPGGGRRPLIVWDARLETGVPEVDRDHQGLVDLLNRLDGALAGHAPEAAVAALLGRVRDHTRAHFAREEAMMTAAEARDLDTHRILHEHLLEDLERVMVQHAEGRYLDLEDLLQTYLKFWLIDHIRNVDARALKAAKAREASEPAAG